MILKKQFMILSIIFAVTLFITAAVFAQAPTGPSNEGISQQEAYSLPQADTSHYAKLLEKAKAEGKVRIIVGVKASFKPEGYHAAPEGITEQRTGIQMAQEKLLKSVQIPDETTIKKYKYIPFMAMEVDEAGLQSVIDNPMVNSIEEDELHSPMLYDTIPLIGADTGEADYSTGYTGSGQTIAILDTGVDKTHSFLSGKVVAEACYSSNDTSQGISSLCPNGQTTQTGSGAGVNCSSSVDGCDHGTHVAGIAAGKKVTLTNGITMRGVAPKANIIAIQVFLRVDNATACSLIGKSSPCISSSKSDQLLALMHVYENRSTYNIASVNMSLGGSKYTSNCDNTFPSYKAVIDLLRSVGIATVIASGNEFYTDGIATPACISSAVSVGATEYISIAEQVAPYSNSASFLSLLAPGGHSPDDSYWELPNSWYGIYSSIPGGTYSKLPGTSMAAPHVAGAWALMKQKNSTASVDTILSVLQTTGKYFTDVNGITTPRIRVDKALAALSSESTLISMPNLTPYKPTGWSDKIAVAITSSATTDSSNINPTDTVYINWAVANNDSANISTKFYIKLYIDGIEQHSWYANSLSSSSYITVSGFSIGSLSAGTHIIKIITDTTGAVSESDETDNEYSRAITVAGSSTANANCEAKQPDDKRLFVPILIFNGSKFWIDLTYKQAASGDWMYKLNAYNVVTNTTNYSGCQASTLSFVENNYILHIWGKSYWFDLQYVPSTDGSLWFKLTDAGTM